MAFKTDIIHGDAAVISRRVSGSGCPYVGITALTKEISNELLKSVTIYPDGYMDVKLNLVDEIQKLMEMLRRETSTACFY